MRRAFLVTYDISDPKRLRRVFKLMHGFGDHLQLSVFRCELTERDRIRLKARLGEVIHHDQDQVLIVDMGPILGRGQRAIEAVGRAYAPRARKAVVV